MMRSLSNFFVRNIVLVLLGCVFFLTAITIHSHSPKPDIKVNKQDSAYTLNSTFIKLISLGNKRVFSNVLWIETLLESDQEKYRKKDFADWMYLRYLTISTLDPLFYENYLYGGMYLSVIKDDLQGAADIFERGLKYYPNDYKLNYYAGFNYFFEMGRFEKGYELLKKIQDHPKAPPLLRQIVAKLQFEVTKNYDVAIALLKENLSLTKDENVKRKLAQDLYSITAQRDLECLNQGKPDCNKSDFSGKPYIKDRDGKWQSQLHFMPYKIFRPRAIESSHPSSN